MENILRSLPVTTKSCPYPHEMLDNSLNFRKYLFLYFSLLSVKKLMVLITRLVLTDKKQTSSKQKQTLQVKTKTKEVTQRQLLFIVSHSIP